MGETAFWGAIGASALIVGAEVAFAFKLSRLVIGLIMAFGVGADVDDGVRHRSLLLATCPTTALLPVRS